jgi:RNA polymerase sigma-70 factor, ECF subfamily
MRPRVSGQHGVTELTDVDLVEAARNGHLESYGELYQRHYAAMVGVAYCVLGDRHLAEDGAQEAFAVAWRDIGHLRDVTRFSGWLRQICRNISLAMARARPNAEPIGDLPAQGGDAEAEQRELVWQAVRQLPASGQEVILLRYFSGLSHEDIALMLDISPQAVHGRLLRARRKLAKRLRRLGLERT